MPDSPCCTSHCSSSIYLPADLQCAMTVNSVTTTKVVDVAMYYRRAPDAPQQPDCQRVNICIQPFSCESVGRDGLTFVLSSYGPIMVITIAVRFHSAVEK
jgi:hypothetical protein